MMSAIERARAADAEAKHEETQDARLKAVEARLVESVAETLRWQLAEHSPLVARVAALEAENADLREKREAWEKENRASSAWRRKVHRTIFGDEEEGTAGVVKDIAPILKWWKAGAALVGILGVPGAIAIGYQILERLQAG